MHISLPTLHQDFANLEDHFNSLEENDLVLVDIDDTLLTASRSYKQLNPLNDTRTTKEYDHCKQVVIFGNEAREIIIGSELVPTSERLLQLIVKASKKVPVLAITGRYFSQYNPTLCDLKRYDIQVSQTSALAKAISKQRIPSSGRRFSKNGILFTRDYASNSPDDLYGKAHVTRAIIPLLQKYNVRSITHLDDKTENLHAVENVAKEFGILYHGTHLTLVHDL